MRCVTAVNQAKFKGLRGESSLGKSMVWKHFASALSYMPCMRPCHPSQTLTSGMEKTPRSLSVHLLQTSNILVLSKITRHMAVSYSKTNRS